MSPLEFGNTSHFDRKPQRILPLFEKFIENLNQVI